jgi:RNA polymerase primary sigma factor
MGGQGDRDLWRTARAGDGEAWAALLHRWSGLIYGCCHKVFDEGECAREFPALVQRLGAERLVILADWDERGAFAPFLALKTADLLADRITSLLATDPRRGWTAFDRFFTDDFARLIRRRLAGTALAPEDGDDLLQELRLRLMADDGAAVRRYDGRGSFTGFVRRIAHNLLEDILRAQTGRRREPEAIRRLDPLGRRAWHLVHVQGYRADQLPLMLRDASGALLPEDEARRVLERVEAALGGRSPQPQPRLVALTLQDGEGREWERPLPQSAPSPEDCLGIARDRAELEKACAALAAAMARLPAEARQYLRLRFLEQPPLPPRRIAERLSLPVEELYRSRKAWEALLLKELRAEGVENFPLSTV